MQTPFHAFVKARELVSTSDLLAVCTSSNIKVFPYQIAAAQFALRSPYLRGVITKMDKKEAYRLVPPAFNKRKV